MKHSLMETCDCELCERARFEHRFVIAALALILAAAGIAFLWASA